MCPKSNLGAAVVLSRLNCGDKCLCSERTNKRVYCNCYKTEGDFKVANSCPIKISKNETSEFAALQNSSDDGTRCNNLDMNTDNDILIWILVGLVVVLLVALLAVSLVLRSKLEQEASRLSAKIVVPEISTEECGFEITDANQHMEKKWEDSQYLSIIQSRPNFLH